MKRHIAIILAALIILSIAGCNQSTFSEEVSSIKSITQYGITAEVVEVPENGKYEVRVTGKDENFDIDDIVTINYDYTGDGADGNSLEVGDIIVITYSAFEKAKTLYEIIPGQIEIIS